ncbi:MAG TPA: type IV pilus twitching motility protein PilT, partial [Armatimonadota bacterium]|nr:type IV pilus twitching motility protein PilT [Armatimonadota bacterium]
MTQPAYAPQPAPQPAPRAKAPMPLEEAHIDDLLRIVVDWKGSDLHMVVGVPPIIRVDGKLQPAPYERMTPQDTQRMCYDILSDEQIQRFESTLELDFSYQVARVARFRVNIYKERGNLAAALRVIPQKIPTMEELGLPAVLKELCHKPRGLVLVTGPTGSGKSTTLAAMLNDINSTRAEHILTVEDPIEYLHNHKYSVVGQRELGMDTKSFAAALKSALREDPDVILVGEMRDLETMQLAVTAAETGHLVFATLHTNSAAQTVDRIVDVFPPGQQEQIRIQLSNNLEGVVTQQLLRRANQPGRVCALEIMMASSAIRNLIREGKSHQINSMIQISNQMGMQTMDQCLRDLYSKGAITYDDAI